jgi:bacillopeptidase F (M6 metalloprotease family)
MKKALNLKQFLLRQEVLKLYRDLHRLIKKVPDESSKRELKQWLRDDFKKNKHQTEELQIKMSIQIGMRQYRELENTLELSGNKKS